MEPSADKYLIDVGAIFRGKLGEKTPKWLIWLGRRLLHEDFLNTFFKEGYTGVEFAEKALEYMHVTLQVEGLEKVPTDRLLTVASNHPLGGHDALALVSIFGRLYDGNIRIMVNDFLMVLKQLNGIFVPVNKMGGQSRSLSSQTDGIFHSDAQVLMFPAGKCARREHGKIVEMPWKKTFLTKSVETHRDIIPMHFYGRNSWRFYIVDWIGKITGVNKKFPLAMALLVDEMYRAQGKTYRVVIGDPIPWQTFDDSRKPVEWAASSTEEFSATVYIHVVDKTGSLLEVSRLLTTMNVYISDMNAQTSADGVATMLVTFVVSGTEQLNHIMSNLRKLKSVIEVRRVNGR